MSKHRVGKDDHGKLVVQTIDTSEFQRRERENRCPICGYFLDQPGSHRDDCPLYNGSRERGRGK